MNAALNPAPEKTLFDVIRDIWHARRDMAIGAVAGVFLASVFVLLSVPHYRAEMLIAPAATMGQDITAQGQYPEGTISVEHKEPLDSLSFLKFENSFFGPSVAGVLMNDQVISAALETDRAFIFSKLPSYDSAETLSRALHKMVRIEPVSGTILRRMTCTHPDPSIAKIILTQVHAITDSLIRAAAAQEADARIDYLNKAIGESEQPEQKRILTDILSAQERLKMFTAIDQPYAASIIEPPFVYPRPVWPDPYLIFPLFILVGLLAGFIAHGFRRHG